MEKCPVCTTRRPRRTCPALGKDICAQCCGSEREETISCPGDCGYLRDGRPFERLAPVDPASVPNADVAIGEEFIAVNIQLLGFCGGKLYTLAQDPAVTDTDLLEALNTLAINYRAIWAGEPAETISANPLAASICGSFTEAFEDLRKKVDEELSEPGHISSHQAMKLVIFFERLAINNNNGRKRGRFFVDFLGTMFIEKASA